jgi:hypothetical protein
MRGVRWQICWVEIVVFWPSRGRFDLCPERLDRDANPSIRGVTTRLIQFDLLAYSDVSAAYLVGQLETLDRKFRISRDQRSTGL